jgi:hypothetical protein
MPHQDPETPVEFGCGISYLLGMADAGILLPAERDSPQYGDERHRRGNEDSLPDRVVEQLGTLFARR